MAKIRVTLRRMSRVSMIFMTTLLLFIGGASWHVIHSGQIKLQTQWRTANRNSTGIAPDPRTVREPLVQVYVARTFTWRGLFGVHPWIAFKEQDAPAYTVAQVLGWRLRRGLPVVEVKQDLPDRLWYDHQPRVVAQLCGEAARRAIPRIREAIANYPHAHEYRAWPGPNSNTFVAHVVREVPELHLDLPATAIGKDYLPHGALMAPNYAGPGMQFSYKGWAALGIGTVSGLDVGILGLSFGISLRPWGIKLPVLGRLGSQPALCQPVASSSPASS